MSDNTASEKLMFPPWVGLAARLIVGAILIAAGLSKASAPSEEFAVVIESYRIVSVDSAATLAALLPWIEIFVGFCLITGYFTRLASIAAGILTASFLGALLSTKTRGIVLPNCGCFGAGFHASTGSAMAMDSVLLALAFVSSRGGDRLLSLDRWAGTPGRGPVKNPMMGGRT